ncbi:MAG: transcription termination factor NusA [Acidobacteriota bacterium]|jgi:N utilization substance protein A|nr:transcription termination factor NusA [Acidobacteriota bacterium]
MITSIGQSIDVLKEEYGLERELVIQAMKEAVLAAARKQFKHEYKAGEGIQVDWNDAEGIVEISAQKEIVAEVESPTTELSMEEAVELTGSDELEFGDMLLLPLPTEELGRIAAQTAKQILVQKVREAIREKVYDEYIDRKGELINGLVKRFERGDIIVDLGTNLEAVLPKREQVRSESWSINERVRVVISDVSKELRGQQVIVSRASSELLKRLFEMEVPEIYDDTVIIKSAVREPGDRAKIAVSSNEKDVDPVGACVGMKGSRVQAIIKELRGEKIDIIEWSDEPSVFAANALSPAKVSQVRITDINERKMEVIVGEDQLSLAIGKRGQNVRLATRLIGWDIDIVSEELLKQEINRQMGQMMASGEAVPITALEGISAVHVDSLTEKGIDDIEALSNVNIDDLVEILDLSLDDAEQILDAAKKVVKLKEEKGKSEETETETAEAEPAKTEISTDETETDTLDEPEETAETKQEEEATETSESEDAASIDISADTENSVEGESSIESENEDSEIIEEPQNDETQEVGETQEKTEPESDEVSEGDVSVKEIVEETNAIEAVPVEETVLGSDVVEVDKIENETESEKPEEINQETEEVKKSNSEEE